MADFFDKPLDKVLPKVLPKTIVNIEEPKKHINPDLEARLKAKVVSPAKNPRVQKNFTLHITNGKMRYEEDDFTTKTLDEVLPKKNARAVEIFDPPRKSISPTLASRLCGTAA